MQNDHYAVVIGISRYPGFTDPPANLMGPENDVEAIRTWLMSATGGGLPEANIKVIRTSDFPTDPKEPSPDQLDALGFFWLDDLARESSDAGNGLRVGQRLYLYMSGHGVSSPRRDGCLLTANAVPRQTKAHICAKAWLDWLKTANYFNEFVLLFDACMNRARSVVPMPAPLDDVVGGGSVGPLFEAYAAMTPLKTIEMAVPEDGGKFHGILTWAFLDGVRGAAVTQHGTVTGQSMANWLRAALRGRLTPRDLSDPEISKEPEITQESARLILARGVTPLPFSVTLAFPAEAVGKQGRIWSGEKPLSAEFVVEAEAAFSLPAGLHLVEVPEIGIRQGFAVTHSGQIFISEQGAKVTEAPPGAVFNLGLETNGPLAMIAVEDARFAPVGGFPGGALQLGFGLYRAQFRVGQEVEERVFLIDRHMTSRAELSATLAQGDGMMLEAAPKPMPRAPSAVPFEDGRFSHESHSTVLSVPQNSARDAASVEEGEAFLVARTWTEAGVAVGAAPWDGVRLLDAKGVVVVDLLLQGTLKTGGDPMGYCLSAIKAGVYFLRYPLSDGALIEQALIVAKGWRTELYLLHLGESGQPRLAVLMHEVRSPAIPNRRRDEQLEVASEALASGRSIRTENLMRLLNRKFENPIEGIIGAHLLRKQRSEVSWPYDEIVENLRRLVGTEHPDVEALSLECDDPRLRRTKPFRAPPMFEQSWDMMIDASQSIPGLVPYGLWNRVSVQSIAPPYFAWSVDPTARRSHRKALRDAVVMSENRVIAPPAGPKPPEGRVSSRRISTNLGLVGLDTAIRASAARKFKARSETPGDLAPGSVMFEPVSAAPASVDPSAAAREIRPSRIQAFSRANKLPPSALRAFVRRTGR